jgi:C4-dicarboxylate-specific signal transduction histidine kinase
VPFASEISADRVQLQQLLINLILKAFDSVCAVEAPREVSAFASESGWINVTVCDCDRASNHI